MKKKTQGTLLLGLLLGGVVLGIGMTLYETPTLPDSSPHTTFPSEPQPIVASPRVTSQDIETLKKDIARLERDRRNLAQDLAATNRDLMALRQQGVSGPLTQPVVEQERSPEEQLQQAEARARAQAAMLEGTLSREPTDPTWASTAQTAIGDAFRANELVGAQLMEAECRTTMCRTKLVLGDGSTPRDIFRNLLQVSQWPGESFAQIDPQSSELVIYLSREGHTFPQITE